MTNRAQSGRDPQKGKKGFSKNKGFTVIELMIVVAMVAVLASLAVPSYRSIIEKRQVTSAAERLTAVLSAVKGESVRLNAEMGFSVSEADKCVGVHQVIDALPSCSFTPNDTDGTCQIACNHDTNHPDFSGIDRALHYAELSEKEDRVIRSISFIGNSNSLVFNPVRGMLDRTGDDGITIELVSTGDMYAMNVGVDRLGRVFVCTKGGSYTPVPGYEDC